MMLNEKSDFIPNHAPSAIYESSDAAILCAAFAELEARELALLKAESAPAAPEYPARISRRAAARKLRRACTRTLPRAARFAACIIGVIAIGMGTALAASSAAREWAVKILRTEYRDAETPDDALLGFEGFYTPIQQGFRSGAAMGGDAYLLESSTDVIRRASDNQTFVFAEREQRSQTLYRPLELCALGDTLYMYCEDAGVYDDESGERLNPRVGRICAVRLGEGAYTLAEAMAFDLDALLGGGLRANLGGLTAAGGKLYMIAGAQGDGSSQPSRLICWDPRDSSSFLLPDMPENPAPPLFYARELFAGPEGALYLSDEICGEDGAFDGVRIYRLEPDGRFAPALEIPNDGGYACGFAYSPGKDSLIYLQNGAIWAAPGMDVSKAWRAGVTPLSNGAGLCPDANRYLLIGERDAELFDLSAPPEALKILRFGGYGSGGKEVNAEFMRAYPDVALESVDDDRFHGDSRALAKHGIAGVDLWRIDAERLQYFLEAGRFAPIESETLENFFDRLYPELREQLSRDGRPVAIPASLSIATDLSYDARLLEQLGHEFSDMDSWPKLLNLLAELSHSARASSFPVFGYDSEDPAQEFSRLLFVRMLSARRDRRSTSATRALLRSRACSRRSTSTPSPTATSTAIPSHGRTGSRIR